MSQFNNTNDTICAIATANGIGAIGLIRVSGNKSLEIVSTIFSKSLVEKPTHTVHFGTILSENKDIIDEVLVSIFQQGKSFTGEESAEIACHGSPYIQQQIMRILLQNGCRLAEPGEFTMRAFMNGKMDLSQAEAVADLIASQSKNAHTIAMKQMRGGFSNELKEIREKLINFASLIELELDFAEEDVEFADRTQLKLMVKDVLLYIQKLAKSFELGNAIKNGVPVAIVGAPNTGKSTLLNTLLGEDRAIVSNIEGTTRDVIEETLNIDGIVFRLIDTAGIRESVDTIENLGIERSLEKINQAQIVVVMSDFSEKGSEVEGHASMDTLTAKEWIEKLQIEHPDKKFVLVGNKSDLRQSEKQNDKEAETVGIQFIPISAKKGLGIDELKQWMVNQLTENFDIANDTIVSNIRHYAALKKTETSLQKAQEGLHSLTTSDWIAMDIRQAMYDLGTITGDISTDDLLGNIFSKFCIGK
ncbi:MAG: tRNA uridine-5-carboxymethylaminomethyl(34) synthesis GTPase MnmE [Flavobacteriia bacterium]|nr:tRNA uridine-5-carboxymethylaminomethyl(34) synthesis GTPase MnmE [Flavobacteriia bacterium]